MLFAAIQDGDIQKIQDLITDQNINIQDDKGNTPLIYAILNDRNS